MADVLFYHLSESRLEDALPPLLEKCLDRNWRVVVQTASDERRDALDQHLWVYRDESFLPHGTDHTDNANLQPIVLCSNDGNVNAAQVRFLVDGSAPAGLEKYERAVLMFDGHDQQQVEAARAYWKNLKSGAHNMTYWQQTPDRRWEKKA